jgi:hypothetical protein
MAMGDIRPPQPALLILGVFSRYESALAWSQERAAQHWGPIALSSPLFAFQETPYYEATMGSEIKKMFLAFERLIDPARLVDAKLLANAWEDAFRRECGFPEPRPLNLDPGYLTEAKLVLATTKDRDHRVYLDRGIFAEVTLFYQAHRWQPRSWTYPDYCRADYHQFFARCRDYLRQRYGRATPFSRDE